MIPRKLPPGSTCSLAVQATPDGIALDVYVHDAAGRILDQDRILIERDKARTFARSMLAAAGDAVERTFPRPPEVVDGR